MVERKRLGPEFGKIKDWNWDNTLIFDDYEQLAELKRNKKYEIQEYSPEWVEFIMDMKDIDGFRELWEELRPDLHRGERDERGKRVNRHFDNKYTELHSKWLVAAKKGKKPWGVGS